ncbi:MAG: hypothetical protein JF609_03370 [Verrucomicrobia bacterium]|nr:hypothetical protein [Verrucomicrobiota bacterium]
MKNSSFDRAMGQIVAQAEAEREQEIKARQRAEWFGRVRNAFILLFIATVLIFACNFHDRIGELVATVMPSKAAAGTTSDSKEPSGKAAVALQGAEQNAAVRDQLIDSLAK